MFAQIGDLKIHYQRSGKSTGGAPIVLVHSLGADLTIFDAAAATLSAEHEVIRYDLRGHGRSPLAPGTPPSLTALADDLGGLLDELGIDAAHLVGQSIGGMVVLALATRRRLTRHTLSLFDTIAWTNERWDSKYAERAQVVAERGMGAIAPTVARDTLSEVTRRQQPALQQRYADIIGSADPQGYGWCCRAMMGFDLRPGLSDVTCPVQLLAGSEDAVTPLAHLREVAALLPDAVADAIPDSGHVPFFEQPKAAAALVGNWVARHPLSIAPM